MSERLTREQIEDCRRGLDKTSKFDRKLLDALCDMALAQAEAKPAGGVVVKVKDLKGIEFAASAYCPACYGWETVNGRGGFNPKAHTKDCWIKTALTAATGGTK